MLCDPAELTHKLKLKDVSSFPEDPGSFAVSYWCVVPVLLTYCIICPLINIIKNQQISSTVKYNFFGGKIYSLQLWLNVYWYRKE